MIRARVCFFLATSFAIVAGCKTTDHEATRCVDIPANGCPLDGANDSCADPTCAAAYACNTDGSWTLDHTCSGFVDGGVHDASRIEDATALRDTSDIDAPPGANGGPGCEPLQDTDCPLGFALACPPAPQAATSCCGCATLFVCTSGSWVIWGECEEDGGIVASGN